MTNKYQKNITLDYRDPYWNLDGVSLGGQIFYNEFEASKAGIVDYTDKSYGGTLTWGFPVDELNYLEFGGGYTDSQIGNIKRYVQIERFLDSMGDKFDQSTNTLNTQDFHLTAAWTRNNLNRGRFPTAGNHQKLYGKMTVPGSDTQYFKAQYDVRQYFPITQSHSFTLLLKGRLGYGNGYGKNGIHDNLLPFYENFYVGGFSTLRGFRQNSVGPQAVYDDPNGKGCGGVGPNNPCLSATNQSVGGNAVALASVELIVPTPFASDEFRNQIRTSVFLDAASLWDTEFQLGNIDPNQVSGGQYFYDYSDPSNYRASVGVAVQWMSPMGPLVFSLATPVKKFEGDKTEAFTFTIGNTF